MHSLFQVVKFSGVSEDCWQVPIDSALLALPAVLLIASCWLMLLLTSLTLLALSCDGNGERGGSWDRGFDSTGRPTSSCNMPEAKGLVWRPRELMAGEHGPGLLQICLQQCLAEELACFDRYYSHHMCWRYTSGCCIHAEHMLLSFQSI
jgi:hypothetical protein